jgi:GntR family transcriptional regulator, arabinose operon transcriptional repressor
LTKSILKAGTEQPKSVTVLTYRNLLNLIDVPNLLRSVELPKYKQILEELRGNIHSGHYSEGGRLPSEAELGVGFSVSRLTVQRALKELQIEGLVDRRAGSGTYVSRRKECKGHLFGLLIPGLGETEIFEPICQGMAKAGRVGGDALLWGDTTHGVEVRAYHAMQLCRDYIDRRVSGVFFAPIEGIPDKDAVNLSITEMLSKASIPIVLLDRCIFPYPGRSRFDLVGIDNRRAGYKMTQHLFDRGCRRPAFMAKTDTAPTVAARIAGFKDAAVANGCCPDRVVHGNPADVVAIREAIDRLSPDGFVCANDTTAVQLMQTLDTLGIGVPDPVRIAGVDDVRYAKHLRVPLTTLHQPCIAMGETAIQVMLSRIAQPNLPARDILLDCHIVERKSCGEAR